MLRIFSFDLYVCARERARTHDYIVYIIGGTYTYVYRVTRLTLIPELPKVPVVRDKENSRERDTMYDMSYNLCNRYACMPLFQSPLLSIFRKKEDIFWIKTRDLIRILDRATRLDIRTYPRKFLARIKFAYRFARSSRTPYETGYTRRRFIGLVKD